MDGNRDRRPKAETDQRILAYLETHPGAQPKQVGDAVRMNTPQAKKRLYQLERAGRVVSEPVPNFYTGRPSKSYHIKPGTNPQPTQAELEEACREHS